MENIPATMTSPGSEAIVRAIIISRGSEWVSRATTIFQDRERVSRATTISQGREQASRVTIIFQGREQVSRVITIFQGREQVSRVTTIFQGRERVSRVTIIFRDRVHPVVSARQEATDHHNPVVSRDILVETDLRMDPAGKVDSAEAGKAGRLAPQLPLIQIPLPDFLAECPEGLFITAVQ